ncbi:MAG: phosphatase PAP2 family protein [Prevotella sp.]|jgi:membrane-associated phospholipid phosphatase|nr:phosphatase PAP2 family protein [Prevotella sp.]MBP3787458.1 phosphatase PAP2 family protein [Prevotella sp.]MBQ2674097.1 phosphatase PAP2 family protein [Prevotella sp.]MBQ3361901.1 phosphatase PAP2 family protein [Prevotella sp.]MBR1412277.1 phosphatase PAP2 family protein [Prevotella sp.]
MKRERQMILAARILSMLFTPFYLPMVGLVALFVFSYMSIFPLYYKLEVLIMAYLFTILIPTVMIHFYRRYQGWNLIELGHRERRMVPYVISIVSYFTCVFVMERLHMPHFMSAIIIAALLLQIVCALINVWWKISTHTAAIGGVAGALFAFAEYLNFNPVWWLCLVFLVAGVLGTSRMILRQHSLSQVVVGFWVGFLCAAVAILFM